MKGSSRPSSRSTRTPVQTWPNEPPTSAVSSVTCTAKTPRTHQPDDGSSTAASVGSTTGGGGASTLVGTGGATVAETEALRM